MDIGNSKNYLGIRYYSEYSSDCFLKIRLIAHFLGLADPIDMTVHTMDATGIKQNV